MRVNLKKRIESWGWIRSVCGISWTRRISKRELKAKRPRSYRDHNLGLESQKENWKQQSREAYPNRNYPDQNLKKRIERPAAQLSQLSGMPRESQKENWKCFHPPKARQAHGAVANLKKRIERPITLKQYPIPPRRRISKRELKAFMTLSPPFTRPMGISKRELKDTVADPLKPWLGLLESQKENWKLSARR